MLEEYRPIGSQSEIFPFSHAMRLSHCCM